MITILQILLFVLMLGLLITLHELGHFVAAKIFKVYIFEFAVGMGPKIFQKKGKETKYSLRAFPIGGFVMMLGEDGSVPEDYEDKDNIDYSRSLVKINRGKRAVIMSAGIIVNFVLAYVLFIVSNALPQTGITRRIQIIEGSAASMDTTLHGELALLIDRIEFKDGSFESLDDKATISSQPDELYYVVFNPGSLNDLRLTKNIVFVNTKIDSYVNSKPFVYNLKEGDSVSFSINFEDLRDKEAPHITKSLNLPALVVDENAKDKTYKLDDFGVSLTKIKYNNTFGEVFKKSGDNFTSSTTLIFRAVKNIFTTKEGISGVSGPIGIFNAAASTLTNFGFTYYIFLWGTISMQLALFNLLPFPGLDGWHLLVITFESIFRRELNPKFKNIASTVGILLLFGLMIVIALKDVIGLII